jgi:penicillin-binding protein 1A
MVNINGLEEINGENYPLDIWSLYMQNAVQRYSMEQFDSPSPDLNLEVKTDGRTYVKPPPPQEKPKEEKSADKEEKDSGSGNGSDQKPDLPEARQTPPAADQEPRQVPEKTTPSSASAAPSSPTPDGG